MSYPTIHDGSGNVFADLGIKNADEYMAKSELAAEILRIVQRRRLTQAEAAKLLGIRHPKVSDLLRGRLDGFSTDRLLRFITRLGYDVQIKCPRHAAQRAPPIGVARRCQAGCGESGPVRQDLEIDAVARPVIVRSLESKAIRRVLYF